MSLADLDQWWFGMTSCARAEVPIYDGFSAGGREGRLP